MNYLTHAQILLIHSSIIDTIGGSHGVRDLGMLQSLDDAPRQAVSGKELYPTLFLKAAVYARTIIMNHPFVDGNKRTGITSAIIFLEYNGYTFSAEEGEIADFAVKIVVEHLEIKDIALWLRTHSKKLRKSKRVA